MTQAELGIDIGTEEIKLVVTDLTKKGGKPQILKHGSFPSRGFRAGAIIDALEAKKSLSDAFPSFIKKEDNFSIEEVSLALSGNTLSQQIIKFKKKIAQDEIFQKDVDAVIDSAREIFLEKRPNRKILHIILLSSFVDGEEIEGNPVGMFAEVLEMHISFITIGEQQYMNIASMLDDLGFSVDRVFASPLVEANVALSYRQKTQGAVLVNIGAETTTISSFRDGTLQSLKVYELGTNHITNDLALAFQVSLDEAEKIKMGEGDYPRRKRDSIIAARVEDIAELIQKEFKEGRKKKYYPAGVILTGGGANIMGIEELLKSLLLVPVEKVVMKMSPRNTSRKNVFIHPKYTASYGVCFPSDEVFSSGKFSRKHMKPKHILRAMKSFLSQIKP